VNVVCIFVFFCQNLFCCNLLCCNSLLLLFVIVENVVIVIFFREWGGDRKRVNIY